MIPAIEHNYVQVPSDQWDAVIDIITDDERSDDEIYQSLVTLFEEKSIPINGYFEVATDVRHSFVDAAQTYWSAPLMCLIAEQAPNKATEGVDIVAESVWSGKAIDILADRGYDLSDLSQERAHTILYRCTGFGAPGAIARLADLGLDLNGLVKYGDIVLPALVHAARMGRSEVLEGLLRAGANPKIAGYDGRTFLHAAVRLDEKKGKGWVDSDDNVDRLRATLELSRELGISVDMRDIKSQTPLHLAAKYGYTNKTKALLEYGADVNALDEDGMTPLALAQEYGNEDTAAVISALKAYQAVMRTAGAAAPGMDR